MFKKLLIANRGEIACRIARTARRMHLDVATVHSSADAGALHVREVGESVLIGAGPARASYLDIEAVIAAALKVGAQAIHPGFGFLSENPAFARRCAEAGLLFIGPTPDTLALFGDKAQAKALAERLGIPTAGGLRNPTDDPRTLLAALEDLPLPYILKAVAGGGGKGMRVVRSKAQLQDAIEAAIREGRSSFGDGRLIAERYLDAPRHIEVQILGDGQGNVTHLFDRECTLQRRHQKVIEEAPVTSLPDEPRRQLWQHAIALGQATRYLGLGTVEFAVTGSEFVFLEVNPRLQVEHPVTEAVTGLDLVEHQIRTVAQRRLSVNAPDQARGVAMQARLYAEDARAHFTPSTGLLQAFATPPAPSRVDAGVDSGTQITPYYDPMIAKFIAHGADRHEAIDRLQTALRQATALGVTHNQDFLIDLLEQPAVRENRVSTEFIDQWLAAIEYPQPEARVLAAIAASCLAGMRDTQGHPTSVWSAWSGFTAWRTQSAAAADEMPRAVPAGPIWLLRADAQMAWKVAFTSGPDSSLRVWVDGAPHTVQLSQDQMAAGFVSVDGVTFACQCVSAASDIHARVAGRNYHLELISVTQGAGSASAAVHGVVRAPMMGQIIALHVQPGQTVQAGDKLAILESMKMEITLSAPVSGIVKSVACQIQSKVERNQTLFDIEA
ncbi:MAG: ATP-grasp domain-containing protein [Desulfovibrionaceae bacterium]|nr:ATP-grasp domain-containing protein [Desulfovibrionaceae bacterium]